MKVTLHKMFTYINIKFSLTRILPYKDILTLYGRIRESSYFRIKPVFSHNVFSVGPRSKYESNLRRKTHKIDFINHNVDK